MKKVYILEELDCANCASKIEDSVAKINGVNTCTVTFLTRKMTLDMEESDAARIIKEAKKIIKKLEPDVEVVER